MIAVITADIENSRSLSSDVWMPSLKNTLSQFGSAPTVWDIYRGDSLQLEISDPLLSFKAAIIIKSALKQFKSLDIRLSIGIGEKTHHGERVTESNGSAFVHSGEQFEQLSEEKIRLSIKTPWKYFDQEMNVLFRLVSIAADHWTTGSAEIVHLMLKNPTIQQNELGSMLNIKQNAVSGRLKRSHYNDIIAFDHLFRQKLSRQIVNNSEK